MPGSLYPSKRAATGMSSAAATSSHFFTERLTFPELSDSFVNKRELTSDERQNSFKNMMTVALEAAIRL